MHYEKRERFKEYKNQQQIYVLFPNAEELRKEKRSS